MQVPDCVDAAKAGCGEGLLWDPDENCLWWIDIAGKTLHRFDPDQGATVPRPMPYLVSALARRADGDLLIATARGIGRLNRKTGDIEILHDPEPDIDGNRLNDIAVAPDGRLWAGTMSEGAKGATGALYRYGPDGAQPMMTGTTISNGLDWSPDGNHLYFIDSVPGVLYVLEGGAWRVLKTFDASLGKPDGLTVDSGGTIWIAICDRGRVLGLTPEGELSAEIILPCEIVTNCTFGGLDLKTLYITTGTFSLSESEKSANPQAGGLFALEMEVAGRVPVGALWPTS